MKYLFIFIFFFCKFTEVIHSFWCHTSVLKPLFYEQFGRARICLDSKRFCKIEEGFYSDITKYRFVKSNVLT